MNTPSRSSLLAPQEKGIVLNVAEPDTLERLVNHLTKTKAPICMTCDMATKRKCPCGRAHFCSVKCQRDGWDEHKWTCAVYFKKHFIAKVRHGFRSAVMDPMSPQEEDGALLAAAYAYENCLLFPANILTLDTFAKLNEILRQNGVPRNTFAESTEAAVLGQQRLRCGPAYVRKFQQPAPLDSNAFADVRGSATPDEYIFSLHQVARMLETTLKTTHMMIMKAREKKTSDPLDADAIQVLGEYMATEEFEEAPSKKRMALLIPSLWDNMYDVLLKNRELLANLQSVDTAPFYERYYDCCMESPAEVEGRLKQIAGLAVRLERVIRSHPEWSTTEVQRRLAAIHNQMAFLHPFIMGNGRTCRFIWNLLAWRTHRPDAMLLFHDDMREDPEEPGDRIVSHDRHSYTVAVENDASEHRTRMWAKEEEAEGRGEEYHEYENGGPPFEETEISHLMAYLRARTADVTK